MTTERGIRNMLYRFRFPEEKELFISNSSNLHKTNELLQTFREQLQNPQSDVMKHTRFFLDHIKLFKETTTSFMDSYLTERSSTLYMWLLFVERIQNKPKDPIDQLGPELYTGGSGDHYEVNMFSPFFLLSFEPFDAEKELYIWQYILTLSMDISATTFMNDVTRRILHSKVQLMPKVISFFKWFDKRVWQQAMLKDRSIIPSYLKSIRLRMIEWNILETWQIDFSKITSTYVFQPLFPYPYEHQFDDTTDPESWFIEQAIKNIPGEFGPFSTYYTTWKQQVQQITNTPCSTAQLLRYYEDILDPSKASVSSLFLASVRPVFQECKQIFSHVWEFINIHQYTDLFWEFVARSYSIPNASYLIQLLMKSNEPSAYYQNISMWYQQDTTIWSRVYYLYNKIRTSKSNESPEKWATNFIRSQSLKQLSFHASRHPSSPFKTLFEKQMKQIESSKESFESLQKSMEQFYKDTVSNQLVANWNKQPRTFLDIVNYPNRHFSETVLFWFQLFNHVLPFGTHYKKNNMTDQWGAHVQPFFKLFQETAELNWWKENMEDTMLIKTKLMNFPSNSSLRTLHDAVYYLKHGEAKTEDKPKITIQGDLRVELLYLHYGDYSFASEDDDTILSAIIKRSNPFYQYYTTNKSRLDQEMNIVYPKELPSDRWTYWFYFVPVASELNEQQIEAIVKTMMVIRWFVEEKKEKLTSVHRSMIFHAKDASQMITWIQQHWIPWQQSTRIRQRAWPYEHYIKARMIPAALCEYWDQWKYTKDVIYHLFPDSDHIGDWTYHLVFRYFPHPIFQSVWNIWKKELFPFESGITEYQALMWADQIPKFNIEDTSKLIKLESLNQMLLASKRSFFLQLYQQNQSVWKFFEQSDHRKTALITKEFITFIRNEKTQLTFSTETIFTLLTQAFSEDAYYFSELSHPEFKKNILILTNSLQSSSFSILSAWGIQFLHSFCRNFLQRIRSQLPDGLQKEWNALLIAPPSEQYDLFDEYCNKTILPFLQLEQTFSKRVQTDSTMYIETCLRPANNILFSNSSKEWIQLGRYIRVLSDERKKIRALVQNTDEIVQQLLNSFATVWESQLNWLCPRFSFSYDYRATGKWEQDIQQSVSICNKHLTESSEGKKWHQVYETIRIKELPQYNTHFTLKPSTGPWNDIGTLLQYFEQIAAINSYLLLQGSEEHQKRTIQYKEYLDEYTKQYLTQPDESNSIFEQLKETVDHSVRIQPWFIAVITVVPLIYILRQYNPVEYVLRRVKNAPTWLSLSKKIRIWASYTAPIAWVFDTVPNDPEKTRQRVIQLIESILHYTCSEPDKECVWFNSNVLVFYMPTNTSLEQVMLRYLSERVRKYTTDDPSSFKYKLSAKDRKQIFGSPKKDVSSRVFFVNSKDLS